MTPKKASISLEVISLLRIHRNKFLESGLSGEVPLAMAMGFTA
jgi:hypothetical protein